MKFLSPRKTSTRWIVALVGTGLATLALGFAGLGLLNVRSDPSDSVPPPTSATGNRPLRIVALGDSFMSGEGASAYYAGTDVPGVDTCRRSPTAYPVAVAEQLPRRLRAAGRDYSGTTLVFVACSGATTANIGTEFDFRNLRTTYDMEPAEAVRQFPGVPSQIEALRQNADADVVLVSVGGNDSRFSEVLMTCTGRARNCIPVAEDWMRNLDEFVQPRLRALYQEVRAIAPNALIYAVKYPNPFGAAECASIGIDSSEARFLRKTFIPRLNEQIHLAAILMGIREIDLFDVFGTQGLCGSDSPNAMNGFRWQRTSAIFSTPDQLLRGSMHPTAAGHVLMANVIAERIVADVVNPGPPEGPPQGFVPGIPMGCPPGFDDCQMPPTLPPFEAMEISGVPTGPWDMAANPNPCTTVATQRMMEVGRGTRTKVADALPESRVCFQTYKGEWQVASASGDGTVDVNFGFRQTGGIGGARHILYQRRDGEWVWFTEFPPPWANVSTLGPFEAWLGFHPMWLVLVLQAVTSLSWGAVFVGLRRWRMRD